MIRLVWLMLYGDWRLGEAQLQQRLSARVHDYREKKTLTVSLIYTRDHAMPCVSNSQTAVTFSIFFYSQYHAAIAAILGYISLIIAFKAATDVAVPPGRVQHFNRFA